VLVCALASENIPGETLDLFLTQEAAEAELREILEDEPEWVNVLRVVPIESTNGQGTSRFGGSATEIAVGQRSAVATISRMNPNGGRRRREAEPVARCRHAPSGDGRAVGAAACRHVARIGVRANADVERPSA
jgi:hypothetical protein